MSKVSEFPDCSEAECCHMCEEHELADDDEDDGVCRNDNNNNHDDDDEMAALLGVHSNERSIRECASFSCEVSPDKVQATCPGR